jgi:hypothetical protein
VVGAELAEVVGSGLAGALVLLAAGADAAAHAHDSATAASVNRNVRARSTPQIVRVRTISRERFAAFLVV